VWPERDPENQGTLIDLDAADIAETITVDGNAYFTVRTSEMTETGYTWEAPAPDTVWNCVNLINANFGDFNTGYSQWLFESKDFDVNCEEDVVLTRTDGAGEDTFKFTIFRGHCPAPETPCETGTIQNLDVTSCEC